MLDLGGGGFLFLSQVLAPPADQVPAVLFQPALRDSLIVNLEFSPVDLVRVGQYLRGSALFLLEVRLKGLSTAQVLFRPTARILHAPESIRKRRIDEDDRGRLV